MAQTEGRWLIRILRCGMQIRCALGIFEQDPGVVEEDLPRCLRYDD